jgi:hypothetical protein
MQNPFLAEFAAARRDELIAAAARHRRVRAARAIERDRRRVTNTARPVRPDDLPLPTCSGTEPASPLVERIAEPAGVARQ